MQVEAALESAAYRLKRSKEQIIETWMNRVRRSIYPARNQIPPALIDSMPVFLSLMSDFLMSEKATHESFANELVLAEVHGTQRAGLQDYTLADVLGEYHILRKVILEILEADGAIRSWERDRILDVIQDVMRTATSSFSKQREFASEKAKDHYTLLQLTWKNRYGLIGSLFLSIIGLGIFGFILYRMNVRLYFIPLSFSLISALYFGVREGFFSLFVTAASIAFFFIRPIYSFAMSDPNDWIYMGLFLFFGSMSVAVAGLQRFRFIRAKSNEAFLKAAQLDQQKLMEERQSHIMELETERELRERFVAALSHDLRNPLSAAKACAQMIARSSEIKDKHHTWAFRINESLTRANKMIEDLLDANQIQGGQGLILPKETCDLTVTIQMVIGDLKTIYGDRFDVEIEGNVIGIWSCSGVQRALENLLVNAIKYGDIRKSISVRAIDLGKSVELSVQNYGKALTIEEQNELFRHLHRSDEARRSGQKGWGIGLTLVRGITEAHKGKVSVKSTLEEGTVFTLTLPKTPVDE